MWNIWRDMSQNLLPSVSDRDYLRNIHTIFKHQISRLIKNKWKCLYHVQRVKNKCDAPLAIKNINTCLLSISSASLSNYLRISLHTLKHEERKGTISLLNWKFWHEVSLSKELSVRLIEKLITSSPNSCIPQKRFRTNSMSSLICKKEE